MTVGIVMLVHTALDRAEQVARHWTAGGCPVVIHVDKKVDRATYKTFQASMADVPHIQFSKRYFCEWGSWGITAATQSAAEMMLARLSNEPVESCRDIGFSLIPGSTVRNHDRA